MNPVVRGAVEGDVVQSRALSQVWELVSLLGGVHLALAVSDVHLTVRPEDGGEGSVRHSLPELTTKAMVNARRCCASQGLSAIRIQVSSTERASSGISRRGRRAVETTTVAASGGKHGLGWAAMQAALPCKTSVSPGLRVFAPTATSLVKCWSGVPCPGAGTGAGAFAIMTRSRPPAESPASAKPRVFVVLSARAVHRAFLARESECTESSEAPTAALEVLAAVSQSLAGR